MTTDDTLRAALFDSPADAVAAYTGAVSASAAADHVRHALGRMPADGKNAVLAEAGKVAAGILDLGITDIFEMAMGKHDALLRAGAATLDDPDSEQLVELVTHTMTFEQRPRVRVHVSELPVATVDLGVRVEFVIRGLLAVVRGGRLTGVRAGSADLIGTLDVAGQQLLERRTTLDLPAVVRFRRGIPLAHPPAEPEGPAESAA